MPVKIEDVPLMLEDVPVKIEDIDLSEYSELVQEDPNFFSILSDDIWKKFELPVLDFESSTITSSSTDIDLMLSSILSCESSEIRNHDCMWAGHCGSKEHPVDDPKPLLRPVIYPQAYNAVKQPQVNAGRSLLLKAQTNYQRVAQPLQQQQQQPPQSSTVINKNVQLPVIESPPNSDDDEESRGKSVLQMLQDAISECDLEENSDLYEYFEDDDIISDDIDEEPEEEQQQQQPPQKQQRQAASAAPVSSYEAPIVAPPQFNSDHCYHKDKNASMRMNSLGIETPSDSEEEIDVVSVEKQSHTPTRMTCALPHNPNSADRHHLQRTVATAMTKNSVKVMPQSRKPATITSSSSSSSSSSHHQVDNYATPKRRAASTETRGVKRAKHKSPSRSPYKRRSMYNHSSDSEPEPSEKRNLHNNMERQRRIDLRNAFEELRVQVPEVSGRERAPKVVILREAATFCDQLTDVSENMLRQVDELRRYQKRLRMRVSQLRLSLAAKQHR